VNNDDGVYIYFHVINLRLFYLKTESQSKSDYQSKYYCFCVFHLMASYVYHFYLCFLQISLPFFRLIGVFFNIRTAANTRIYQECPAYKV
jgi:hypothetical protein